MLSITTHTDSESVVKPRRFKAMEFTEERSQYNFINLNSYTDHEMLRSYAQLSFRAHATAWAFVFQILPVCTLPILTNLGMMVLL